MWAGRRPRRIFGSEGERTAASLRLGAGPPDACPARQPPAERDAPWETPRSPCPVKEPLGPRPWRPILTEIGLRATSGPLRRFFGQVRDHELDQRPATRPQPRALQNLGQDGRLLGSRRPRPNPVSPRRPRTDGRAVLREFRRPSLETSTRLPGHPFGATYGALTSAYPITVVPSSPYTGRGGCRVPSEVSSGRVPSSTVARLVVSSL